MIDNNIIQSLGAGSGIDTKNLVKQLTEIERAAPQARIDTKREHTESQISDFGTLSSAMDKLKTSLTALTDPAGMFSKSASFTDSSALAPSKLEPDAQVGTYALEVLAVARAQSLSFAGFSDPKAEVGHGELTFSFGNWERDETTGAPTAFNEGAESESFSIKIDSSNNSLEGLRDAINKADQGVQASIINDGSSYRLVVTAPSGESNELAITVDDPGSDLARFSYNDAVTNFSATETQKGADAMINVNGLMVRRDSNIVDDIVDGLTLDIKKADPGEIVTVTITDDKNFAEQNVREFVEAFNAFLEETQLLFGYDKEEEKMGSLANDSLAKSVMSRFRGTIASAVPGVTGSNFNALASIGILTELDGTLSIDEKGFTKAFNEDFESVQKLFAPSTHSSSSDITVNSYGNNTKAGNYDVQITTPPSKGFFAGDALGAAAGFPNFDPAGKDYSFTIAVNGSVSNDIVLPSNVTYSTPQALASALEAAINSDEALSKGDASVSVVYDSETNSFTMTSNRYGSNSNVSIRTASDDFAADLGLAVGAGNAGRDVAGTVNGVEGFGLGNVLLPRLGEAAEGLSLIVGENATSSTVSLSRGFAGQMQEVIDGFLKRNGLIDTRQELLERRLEGMGDEEEKLDRRISAFEERLMRQFIAMERILNSLNSQGGFMESLIDTLPFTAKK